MKKTNHITILLPGIIFCCFHFQLAAQDSLYVHKLLMQVQERQVQQDAFFMQGIFPSYISNEKRFREKRKDNNGFYTALILYTLKSLKPELSLVDQIIVDSIAARAEKVFARFKNCKGRESYNYWRTDSAYRFPFIWWIPLVKKNILADDPDCTAICLLALKASDSFAQKAHAVMQDYANDIHHPTHTVSSKYRSYGAYSGWLWNHMPAVFDVCAISNILSLVQTYNLPWTKADSASFNLILATLRNKEYISSPLSISPYYGSTSVILYHLARLMSIKPLPALEAMKDTLINEAVKKWQQTDDELEKIILNNALLKWNCKTSVSVYGKLKDIEQSNLPFVIANMPSLTNYSIRKTLTKKGIGLFYYYCPAYNDVLLLENLVLKNK